MKNREMQDVENLIKSIKLSPAPGGLRERILDRARARGRSNAGMTPLLWKTLVGCAAALAFILIADGLLSRTQQSRLQALLDGSGRSESLADDEGPLLAEALGDPISTKMLAQEKTLIADRTSARRARLGHLRAELLGEDFENNENIY